MQDGGPTGCAVRDRAIYLPVLDECRRRGQRETGRH